MGGSGGAASTTNAVQVEKSHELILRGVWFKSGSTDINFGWDDTVATMSGIVNLSETYASQPSALRFLYEKGLTDVGGNPYEGVSTYSPDQELETAFDGLDEMQDSFSNFPTWSEAVDTADTKAASIVDSINIGTMFTTALAAAQGTNSTLHTISKTDAEAIYDSAVSKSGTDLASQVTTVNVQAPLAFTNAATNTTYATVMAAAKTAASSAATACITSALASAGAAVDETIITDMVTAYRAEALKTHLRSINRFTGGMSDINAVNSSAFVFGMALLESDYTNDVNKFQAELRLKVFEMAFDKWFSFTQAYINAYMQAHIEQLQIYASIQEGLRQTAINYIGELLKSYQGVMSSFMQNQTGFFSAYFEGLYKEAMDARIQKVNFTQNGADAIIRRDTQLFEINKASAGLLLEAARIKAVLKSEEYGKNMEYDVKSAVWDMELFQMAGNLISASSGSVVSQAGKPSMSQSVMGGALAGASVGAPTGGPGAIIGGVVGAIGGAVSN